MVMKVELEPNAMSPNRQHVHNPSALALALSGGDVEGKQPMFRGRAKEA